MILNIMMDPKPMWPELFHFTSSLYNREYTKMVKPFSRTERPPRYYWTDFGLSRRYDPEAGPRRELPILGGDKTVPEHQGRLYDVPSDPMPTDVYFVGNLIREYFLDVSTLPPFERHNSLMPYRNTPILDSCGNSLTTCCTKALTSGRRWTR